MRGPLVLLGLAVLAAIAVGRQSNDDFFLLPTGEWAERLLAKL